MERPGVGVARFPLAICQWHAQCRSVGHRVIDCQCGEAGSARVNSSSREARMGNLLRSFVDSVFQRGDGQVDADGIVAPNTAAKSEPAEDGDIASHLASIEVVRTTRNRLMLEPWRIFEKYPANNHKKKSLYVKLDKAKRALRRAEQVFQSAGDGEAKEKALEAFQDAAAKAESATHKLRDAIISGYWKDHALGQRTKKVEARQRKLVKKLAKRAKSDKSPEHAEKLADARAKLAELTALKGEYYADVEAEVESRMELSLQVQNIYEVTCRRQPGRRSDTPGQLGQ